MIKSLWFLSPVLASSTEFEFNLEKLVSLRGIREFFLFKVWLFPQIYYQQPRGPTGISQSFGPHHTKLHLLSEQTRYRAFPETVTRARATFN